MSVHIYYHPGQPLTKFVDHNVDPPTTHTFPPYKRFRCESCGRLRAAKNLKVHVYYDCWMIFCREKEYGRSSEFPFEYRQVCKGAAWKPPC